MSEPPAKKSDRIPEILLGAAVVLGVGAGLYGLRARGPESAARDAGRGGRVLAADPSAPAMPGLQQSARRTSPSGLEMVGGAASGSAASERSQGSPSAETGAVDAASLQARLHAAFGPAGLAGELGEPAAGSQEAAPAEPPQAGGQGDERRVLGQAGFQGAGFKSGGGGSSSPGGPAAADQEEYQRAPATPAGFLLSHFTPPQRERLTRHLEQGIGLVAACKSSGLAPQCMAASQGCLKYQNCQRWLSGQLASTAGSAGGRQSPLGGGVSISGPGAFEGEGDSPSGQAAAATAGALARGGGGGSRAPARAPATTPPPGERTTAAAPPPPPPPPSPPGAQPPPSPLPSPPTFQKPKFHFGKKLYLE